MPEKYNYACKPAATGIGVRSQVLDTDDTPAKTSWPELLGMTAEEAEKKIKEEMVGAYTPVHPANGVITCDYVTNRVRLFVDNAGKIVRSPMIG